MRKVLYLFCLLTFSLTAQKREEKEKEAFELAQKAIELMDFGKIDESIELLEKCRKLDPTNFNYPYELGYAYHLKRDYSNAIRVYKKVIKYKDATDQCFQMLGNIYDISGDKEGAIKTYEKGLKKFPNSGKLYFELGNIQETKDKSLKYYEKGIDVDPQYPSNYYIAAKLFLTQSDVEMWGLIYGELFMNIERGSARTEEISQLLYDTYKKEIKFTSDTSQSISLYSYTPQPNDPNKIKIPFGIKIYEPTLILSMVDIDSISIASLAQIRTNFTNIYFKNEFQKQYPNVIFDWQKWIQEKGFSESYNYWLLMRGNEKEFNEWYKQNSKKFDDFITWFSQNKLLLNERNHFIRFE